jgi:cytochrome b pre-mRNA-processing protein 3
MKALRGLFRSRETGRLAGALYGCAVAQGRQPGFYAALGVPDTVDGRFEMIALHVWLLLHRLREGDARAQALAQAVFDAMFQDMDRALREMGAGDLGVGRRVKAMATAFYGRIAAYDRGIADDGRVLDDALIRNVWRGNAPDVATVAALAHYLRREVASLSAQPLEGLLAGEAAFGAPPSAEKEEA